MHVRVTLVAACFCAACAPDVAMNSGNESGGESSLGASSDGSSADATSSEASTDSSTGLSTTTQSIDSSSSSVESSSSDDTGNGWGEPVRLAELDGDPLTLAPQYIVVAGEHVHIGTLLTGAQSRHWVLDRDSGELVATSPAAGALAVTAESVYSAGYRTGEFADGEFSIVRMAHDGSAETELSVTDEAPHVFAASSSRAFIQFWPDYDHFETWACDDGLPSVELLVDTGQQSMGSAIYLEDVLLTPAFDEDAIASLGLDSLSFGARVELPTAATVLGSAAELVLAGTGEGLLRIDLDGAEEPVVVDPLPASALAADTDAIVWLAGDPPGTLSWTSAAGGEVIEMELEGDLRGARNVALAPDAVYVVAVAVDTTAYAGTVWKLDRPG
jgi:hypothetical protein